ncbi:MAG TPA: hypothetical protein PKG96_09815 [Bacilli bacterium]|nr:hypothetical protein [Bacilli bacterium]
MNKTVLDNEGSASLKQELTNMIASLNATQLTMASIILREKGIDAALKFIGKRRFLFL